MANKTSAVAPPVKLSKAEKRRRKAKKRARQLRRAARKVQPVQTQGRKQARPVWVDSGPYYGIGPQDCTVTTGRFNVEADAARPAHGSLEIGSQWEK